MAGAILVECESCGKSFPPNKHKASRYCSMPCYRAAQRSGAYKRGHGPEFPRAPCAHCGALVVRRPSARRNGEAADHVFCNRVCYDSFRTALQVVRSKPCDECGMEFVPDAVSRRFCSEACWKANRKAGPKNCLNCGCLFTPIKLMPATGRFISTNSGKTCSAHCHNQWIRNNPERKRKIGDAFRGANHPNWQGGKSLMNDTSNRGPNWSAQRARAIKRDGGRCVDCGMTVEQCVQAFGRSLDVDHETPFHNFTDYRKANVLSNLRSRCASCHRIAEAKRSMTQMLLPMQDSRSRQHKGYAVGERHPRATITNAEVVLLRRLASDGVDCDVLARRFGVTKANAQLIIRRKTWKSVL